MSASRTHSYRQRKNRRGPWAGGRLLTELRLRGLTPAPTELRLHGLAAALPGLRLRGLTAADRRWCNADAGSTVAEKHVHGGWRAVEQELDAAATK